jgi:cytochrome c2
VSSETPNEGGHKKPPIPTPAKKIPALNIEKRGDRLYEANYLHKWFAISSLLLFLFTIGMVIADYSREWRKYQRDFVRMQVERTSRDMDQASAALDRNKLTQLQQQLDQTRAEEQQNEDKIEELQDQVNDLNAQFYAANQNYQFTKAIYDTDKYTYDEALAQKKSNAQSLGEDLKKTEEEMNAYRAEVEKLTLDLRNANAELDKYVGRRNTIQKEMDTMMADYRLLETRRNNLDPGFIVTSFRNAPVFDFMNPSERIDQILLPNLFYDHPFMKIPRVDRCTTCHQGIDNRSYEKDAQPFKTHPRLDLFLSAGSPHPKETFGCTSCHSGLDRATSFQNAGHTPSTPEQQKEWEEKYGWHLDHFLETPMHPKAGIEAGCYKCHNASPEVPGAGALNNGRDLIRIYGCFGCHRIPGYEGVRKVGPDLGTVSGKLTKDWIKKWLANPKEFKSEARMPQFWGNSNNKGTINGTDFEKRNVAEITAITEYLWANSKPKELPAGRTGNAEAGKQIVETVGCFGCHAIGPIEEAANQSQTRRRHGFNLANQGSKVSASWLYNWVKDPRSVWPGTKMPNLRLTDEEAANVAAYLASQKNQEWEAKPFPEVDQAGLDEVMLELLRANSTDIEAREKLKAMSVEQKNLFAGERLIGRYGCFGCHDIPKFENAQPIGTELTEAGSKLLAQFDFGFLPVEHSRHSFYEQKLLDPRIFDVGRVKRPEELLKMPNFHFADKDVASITMVLDSMVREPVPLEMRDRTTAGIAEGRLLIAEKNCKGCHIIEGAGGDIRPTKEQAQWPPNLNTQGFKTQPLWLHPFLKDPGTVKLRPWLTARMPTFYFTEEEAVKIERYFSELDRVPYPFISTEVDTTSERLQAGAELFNKLQCMQCHPTSAAIPPGKMPEDLAPNLQLASQRLRPDWILEWIRDPQRIFPGTRMPTYFADPSGTPMTPFKDILGGDVKAQIQALRDHLFINVGGGRRAGGSITK